MADYVMTKEDTVLKTVIVGGFNFACLSHNFGASLQVSDTIAWSFSQISGEFSNVVITAKSYNLFQETSDFEVELSGDYKLSWTFIIAYNAFRLSIKKGVEEVAASEAIYGTPTQESPIYGLELCLILNEYDNKIYPIQGMFGGYLNSTSPDRVLTSYNFDYPNKITGSFSITNRSSGTTPVPITQKMVDFADSIEVTPDDTDPYADLDGESDITGGGTVSIPGLPSLTATSTGIIGLFAPSAAEMQALASFMWTDFGGQGSTTEDILKEIVEALKRSISNPLDYVIGLNIIPSQGLSIGASSTIRFGFVSSGVSMPRLLNQYFTVDCGSIDFDPVCGDTFLDYAPYSKFSIYLPYIGVKEVDANDFVGHRIGVIYHGDTVTGGVTAYITKDGSVMYQYSGCCALNIPLSADNWGNTISGAVQIATSIVGSAVSGGAAGIAQAAISGVASVAANPSLLSPQVAHSGAISGGAGCMGVQYPFVIREAVRFHSTEYFNTIAGYPSFYYRSLAEVSGFTKVVEVHLHNMTGTQQEVSEIEDLLKRGVIL